MQIKFQIIKNFSELYFTWCKKNLRLQNSKGLIELQMPNCLKFGSVDKLNDKACSEIVNVIAAVIVGCLTDYFKECNFITASAGASEARKTSKGIGVWEGDNQGIQWCCSMLLPS